MAFSWPQFKSLWKGNNHIKVKTNTNQFIFILNLLIFCVSQNIIWGTPTQEEYAQANLIANQHELNAVQVYLLWFWLTHERQT